MSSIIEGYNYDIFISYRQKDNKGDKWVSEFVEALSTELESTFKEEISVYFDINPHDGLLETHDVDASLKDKLKCLVFIPIISRTYCDPKSFAWEHEFKAFVEQASQDQFGLKVKLPSGNVASRVLPARIHDLDNADIKLFESLTGGFLRGVEFIYQESGVNRPLRSNEDRPNDNLNRTFYRNQINKVANAVKEIISRLKTIPVAIGEENVRSRDSGQEVRSEIIREVHKNPFKSGKIKILSGFLITAIVLMAVILIYPKIFKPDKLENLRSSDGRISVAVMPFQNMTNDTSWNVWQVGIQSNLINSLSNVEELRVRQPESVNSMLQHKSITDYSSITTLDASSISQKLDANVFINGSINEAGSIIRINAQLFNSNTNEAFKSFKIDGTPENILHIVDSLSIMAKNFLIISKLTKEMTPDIQKGISTNFPDAYKYFIYGENARRIMDDKLAAKYYLNAITIDSNFTYAIIMLSFSYYNMREYDLAKSWCHKVYRKREMMNIRDRIWVDVLNAQLFETPSERIKYLRQFQKIDDQNPSIYYQLGYSYRLLSENSNVISELEKSLEIYKNWNLKPYKVTNYTYLGASYHKTGQFNKEKLLYKRAEHDFPDDPQLIYRQAILSFSQGDTSVANGYIKRYISFLQGNSTSEAEIKSSLAEIYKEAGILDKAEASYREAFSIEPGEPWRMNNLAYFLIDTDRNINEGLELNKKALDSSPSNIAFLHCKGWGLYKQGKYNEALEILQKSWDLRLKNAIYDHEAFLHLEAAKKAVANQKNN